ncbi:MAG: 1-deoxy-D-xylulose-5-phosphate reductoisomerase [Planctomycetota bacterium]
MPKHQILILGSTGSIGKNALSVLEGLSQNYHVFGLSAHKNLPLLLQQIERFQPKIVTITDEETYEKANSLRLTPKLCFGTAGLTEMIHDPAVTFVLSGITGAAGLLPSWEAIQAQKPLGLANKESLVMAGHLLMKAAREKQTPIIPIDSEHSAIFQCLQGGKSNQIKQIILTSSGGPFRNTPRESFPHITPAQALKHPTWNMGNFITINSATMMNKALEILEAHWLFDLSLEQIQVAIHPQSIIHSMIEWIDGSILAQLSEPDMRLPIQYALTYPERAPASFTRFSFEKFARLEFFEPDYERFPSLRLGQEAVRRGGTCGAILNAANEAAIELFFQGQITFDKIPQWVQKALETHPFLPHPTLEEILVADQWARAEVNDYVLTLN